MIRAAFGVDGASEPEPQLPRARAALRLEDRPGADGRAKEEGQGRVGREVRQAELLRGRDGEDVGEVRAALHALGSTRSRNTRTHGTTHRQPIELFAVERRRCCRCPSAASSRSYGTRRASTRTAMSPSTSGCTRCRGRLIGQDGMGARDRDGDRGVRRRRTRRDARPSQARHRASRRTNICPNRACSVAAPQPRLLGGARRRASRPKSAHTCARSSTRTTCCRMLRTVQAMVTHLEKFPAPRGAAACLRAEHYGSYRYGAIKNILRDGLDLDAARDSNRRRARSAALRSLRRMSDASRQGGTRTMSTTDD